MLPAAVVTLPGLALALGFFLAPLAAGAYARRNLGVLERTVFGSQGQAVKALRLASSIAYVCYAAILFLVFLMGNPAVLVQVPPTNDGYLLFSLLSFVAAVLIMVGVVAKRQELVAIKRDLNERERIQKELERSNRDLEQLAYVASHDLKEPLRMVSAYTTLLQKRYQGRLDPDADEFIRYAVDGAERMKVMIDDLLRYARLDAKAERDDVPLSEILDGVRLLLRQPILETNAVIEAADLPVVHGNRSQLTQLFQNLVANSLKFRRPDRAPFISIATKPQPGGVLVSVHDNGIGIPQKHLGEVFDLFRSLHPRDKYPGTGIGLAVCKRIVEHHGGRIWAESDLGEGTTFHFTLPTPPSPDGAA